MHQELIAGQCENCGHDYQFTAILAEPIICPSCKLETHNWDTVEYSQMAPSLIAISPYETTRTVDAVHGVGDEKEAHI